MFPGVSIRSGLEPASPGASRSAFPVWLGSASALAGLLVLGGWLAHSEVLTAVIPGRATMKPNTALCFVAGGLALASMRRRAARHWLRLPFAGFVTLVGALTLVEWVFGLDLRIDQALLRDSLGAPNTPAPGRMGIHTAASFVVVGVALLVLDARSAGARRFAEVLAVAVMPAAFISFVGHLYGVEPITPFTRPSTQMAVHTSLLFLAQAIGVLAAVPDGRIWQVVASRGRGGQLVRQLLPVVPGVVIGVGWLRLLGEQAGLYRGEFGVALLVGVATAVLLAAVFWQGWLIDRSDQIQGRVEGELRDRDVRLRTILEDIGDPVLIVGLDGHLLDLNPPACALLGYTREELLRLRPSAFDVDPDLTPAEFEDFGRFVRDSRAAAAERRLRRKDGSLVFVDLRANPVVLDGEPHLLILARDVSERRREEARRLEALEEQQRSQRLEAIARLAGGLAHDFNNLLLVINGVADQVIGRTSPQDELCLDMDEIRQAGRRATELARQLLVFARRHEARARPVDLNALVAGLAPMLERLLGDQIELRLGLAPDAGWIQLDPGAFEQALMHLVLNARDAMPGGGEVSIATSSRSLAADPVGSEGTRLCVLSVSDSGAGVEPGDHARLFEPFFTTKPPGSGAGLGLALVHGVVKQAGGEIRVDSRVGEGSRFEILLPAVAAHANPSAPEVAAGPRIEPSPEGSPRGTERILLVEDEAAVRSFVRRVLEAEGYPVSEAANAEEALAWLGAHAHGVALLLSDMALPGMSGAALATAFQQLRPDGRALLMSGYPERAGIVSTTGTLLDKPFTARELVLRVREVLGAPAPGARA